MTKEEARTAEEALEQYIADAEEDPWSYNQAEDEGGHTTIEADVYDEDGEHLASGTIDFTEWHTDHFATKLLDELEDYEYEKDRMARDVVDELEDIDEDELKDWLSLRGYSLKNLESKWYIDLTDWELDDFQSTFGKNARWLIDAVDSYIDLEAQMVDRAESKSYEIQRHIEDTFYTHGREELEVRKLVSVALYVLLSKKQKLNATNLMRNFEDAITE